MSCKLYKTVFETINLSKIECYVYGGFVENIPYYFRKYPERIPLYSNTEGFSKSSLTIAELVDRFTKGEQVTIINPEDTLFVLNCLEDYIHIMNKYVEQLADPNDPAKLDMVKIKNYKLALESSKTCSETSWYNGEVPKEKKSAYDIVAGIVKGMV